MGLPLVLTKLFIPPMQPGMVSRPRLVERLNAGLCQGHRLTLIAGPAGSGKTTLVSEWIARGETCGAPGTPRFAWLSLDGEDNDLARFFIYLLAAIQKTVPGFNSALYESLQSPEPPAFDLLLPELINELAGLPGTLALVLDDFHTIEDPAIHKAMAAFIDHLPPNVHLAITSRADPLLPLARLRARQQLTEVREADLYFTLDEAGELLNDTLHLSLSREDVAALEERTEGWVVGLQLAAQALKTLGVGDPQTFIQTFTGSHRYLLEFLVEEVLRQQPEETQQFLLQTSILERMCASLCESVAGNGAPAPGASRATTGFDSRLSLLAHSNLFIVRLDNAGEWYRYHHLFADLLRTQLRRLHPDWEPALHRRASAWFAEHALIPEAIQHGLVAQEYDWVADLIQQQALPLLMQGEMKTVLKWLQALPEPTLETRPWLQVYFAWCLLLTGQLQRLEHHLQMAERNLPEREMAGQIAAIRTYAVSFALDPQRIKQYAQQALDLLPPEALNIRSIVLFSLGVAGYIEGDLEQSYRAMRESGAAGLASGNIHIAVPALCSAAGHLILLGDLDRAEAELREVLQRLGASPLAARVYSTWGDIHYERNELDLARRDALDGVRLARLWGNPDVLFKCTWSLARVLWALGERAQMATTLDDLEQMLVRYQLSPNIVSLLLEAKISAWLEKGNPRAARTALEQNGIRVDIPVSFIRESEFLALARVLLAMGEEQSLAQAGELLERLEQRAAAGTRTSQLVRVLVLRAVFWQQRSDRPRALDCLRRALRLAEPQGMVRTFLDADQTALQLLRTGVFPGVSAAYLARLRSAAEEGKSAGLVEPLSQRELEVLRLLAVGHTNPEICLRLVLALGTVKAHTANIYGKLGVRNRTEAVQRARELKLI